MAIRDSLRIAWDIITVLRYVALRCYPKYQRKQEEEQSFFPALQVFSGGWGIEVLHFRAPVGLHLGVWF